MREGANCQSAGAKRGSVPEVQLVRENESEVYFAHRPLGGVVLALIGAGIAWVAWAKARDTTGQWIGLIGGGVFALIGIGAALWRYELRLDLGSRRYTRRKGFWPSPRRTEGGLEEIEGVALDREERRAKNHTYLVWVVKLAFRGEKPVSVHEARDEAEGYGRAESLAKRLRMPLRDRTEMPERVTEWEKLDETLAERAAAQAKGWSTAASVSRPPLGSRIQFDETPTQRRIELPAAGVNLAAVLLWVFGLGFGSFGGFFLWAKVTGAVPVKENTPGVAWIIAPLFMLFGLGFVLLGVLAAVAREVVQEEGDTLAIGTRGLGRDWLMKRFAKREIEQIEVRVAAVSTGGRRRRLRVGGVAVGTEGAPQAPGQEVMVRSDRALARLGRGLRDEERQWLRDTLAAMASGA